MGVQAEGREAGISWPEHIGVGGLGLAAARALPADHSGHRARAALEKWSCAIPGGAAPAARAVEFPFADILPHYQTVGRLWVAPEFLANMRNVAALLRDARPVPGEPAWLLAWLISATDQESGNYESFLGEELLERAVAASGHDEDEAVDVLIGALLADLAAYEADAQRADSDSRRQRTRTAAAAQALSRLERLAPRAAAGQGSLDSLRDALSAQVPAGTLIETASDTAVLLLAVVAAPLRYAVSTSMMPITPLHDEYMFMRCVQVFEILYWQVVRCLGRAVSALLRGDRAGTCGQLADAASRLEATPALYRVLTTMTRESFAIIRGLTDGRSAIQSRPYRLVEMLSAPRELSAEIRDKVPGVEVSGVTLQEAFEEQSGRLGQAALRPVAEAMARLDTAWRAMKRTHWGITLKIIGNVPGTGGTTGVRYLEAAARVPLFPLLHEAGDLDGGC